MLPQLREIERRFAHEVAIVGVHSGKYPAERETRRIRHAAIRLGNTHPIVNDRQFRIWRSYAVRAWPTLVVIDPNGAVLGTHAGEFTAEMLAPFLERAIASFEATGELDRTSLTFRVDEPVVAPGLLAYPGKVAIDGDRMAVADTGHHRLLVGRLDEAGRRLRVEREIGGMHRGFADGARPTFDTPQGVLFDGDSLLVADSGNHAVRRVALSSGSVTTLAGTGRRLRSRDGLGARELASPWDLALADDTLFVAMAGTHQLFAIDPVTGAMRIHCGSGAEEIHDGPHHEAALAQPMGIVASGSRLWFVDAESSAVRWADIDVGGRVGTLTGTGLFDFGDKDGAGDEVRMQHQQGLTRHPSGRLLVADSYNDALKWVDPANCSATTWRRGFHEPSGIAIGRELIYVADTNAHRIATVDEHSGEIETLEIAM